MDTKEATDKIVHVDMEAEYAAKKDTTEEDAPKITLLDAYEREADTIRTYHFSTLLKARKIRHKDMDNN